MYLFPKLQVCYFSAGVSIQMLLSGKDDEECVYTFFSVDFEGDRREPHRNLQIS